MSRIVTIIFALAALAVSADVVWGAPGAAQKEAPVSKSNLERWNELTKAERAELQRRFDRLQSMSVEERGRVKRRAEGLRRETAQLLRSLGDEERATIEALEPKERQRVLRSLVKDRARLLVNRVRDRMTPEERAALEAASPDERDRILAEFRKAELERLPERLAALGEELGVGRAGMRRIQAGAPEDQRREIANLVRRRAKRSVEENGLPAGFEEARWERMLAMDDEPFLRAMQRARMRHPELGMSKARWEAKLTRRAALADHIEGIAWPKNEAGDSGPRRLEREAVLRHRKRIEETIIRQLRVRMDQAVRLRAMDDDAFVAAFRFTLRTVRSGAQFETSLDRWLKHQDRAGVRARPGKRRK